MDPADPVQGVLTAWTDSGPHPWRHTLARRKLRKDWPALAVALEEFEEAAKHQPPPDDGPTRRIIPVGRYVAPCPCEHCRARERRA